MSDSGKDIITVEATNPARGNSVKTGPIGDEDTIQMEQADAVCLWNDQEFSAGSRVSDGEHCYECSFGRWIQVD